MPRVPRELSRNGHTRDRSGSPWLPRVLRVLVCAGLAQALTGCGQQPHTALPGSDAAGSDPRSTPIFPVAVRTPEGAPRIATGTLDEKGRPVSVACATCHATRPAYPTERLDKPLVMFHQGLVGKHGDLSCTSCHNPTDGYASLRLADGKSVPFPEVMTLCAQCHGPQFRDYQHGAHGGMTGYWDLAKGGRVRNNCIDCHDPHAPRYPTVAPARGPNDRFQHNSGRAVRTNTTGGGHE